MLDELRLFNDCTAVVAENARLVSRRIDPTTNRQLINAETERVFQAPVAYLRRE